MGNSESAIADKKQTAATVDHRLLSSKPALKERVIARSCPFMRDVREP
jgi:hypothetical protein